LIEDAPVLNASARVFPLPTKRHLIAVVLAVAVAAGIGANVRPAHAAEAPVGLGTAGSYGVLGGQAVTNTGPTSVGGNLGVSPGSSYTGFPPGLVGGAIHAADDAAAQAQLDLTTAYDDAASRALTLPATSWTELGNQSFVPGVYEGGALTLTGDVTLVGDADSVFIFRANSSIVTASGSRVLLSGDINPCNVFWQIRSTATLGTHSTMVGTMMALISINAATGASVAGRLLARNGAVTLDSNVITRPLSCGADAAPAPEVSSAPPAIAVPGKATFTG
jgi:hypothetical protein